MSGGRGSVRRALARLHTSRVDYSNPVPATSSERGGARALSKSRLDQPGRARKRREGVVRGHPDSLSNARSSPNLGTVVTLPGAQRSPGVPKPEQCLGRPRRPRRVPLQHRCPAGVLLLETVFWPGGAGCWTGVENRSRRGVSVTESWRVCAPNWQRPGLLCCRRVCKCQARRTRQRSPRR